jgi:hypothetical protein
MMQNNLLQTLGPVDVSQPQSKRQQTLCDTGCRFVCLRICNTVLNTVSFGLNKSLAISKFQDCCI